MVALDPHGWLRKSNVQASDWKVQDLNADPKLPYGDGELLGNHLNRKTESISPKSLASSRYPVFDIKVRVFFFF